ncbi:AcvB/VirJ family lysyl-phosphatidylglycerol hydrolase [Stenotrophomonas maltophilia]|uniref:Acid virulence protein B n=1 Tax=Stenotrophomonas maltophilia TaxID=40324 RepID=A0AAP7GSG9_STEMA|nr:AcvB/VirJ family lysyl-phosphatidylglycerol hydrolase [Stenotrophomonas maltophilia]MDZ5841606.1 AcvB/VirJ family lysyl-phosphatidylglycerol hydrolase [Stenotrophomonas maltophilia]OBU61834.1 acid virulence protein B [Stenotrophomonas maltophilia]
MTRAGLGRAMGLVMALAALPAVAAASVQQVSHGRFEQVPVHLPAGVPQRVVIWFHEGPYGAASLAPIEALRADGALVAAVDVAHLRGVLEREGDSTCSFGAGDVENFSRWVQAFLHLPGYHLPLVGGDGEGAELAYSLAAQADTQVFAGLLTSGFCPDHAHERMVCGDGVKEGRLQPAELNFPWLNAIGDMGCRGQGAGPFVQQVAMARGFKRSARGDATPGLVAAARVIGAQAGISLAPPPAALKGLPVVEVPAHGDGDTLAIFVSGDGGWAGLDKDVASSLAEHGVAVVGIDSLRYFWSERTPEGFAADLQKIIDHYRQQWRRDKVMLIGFSQGADVLPATINRLDAGSREALERIVLLSVGRKADFEFHVSNWLGGGGDGLPIAPEVARLPAAKTLCVYGDKDEDALCPDLPANEGVRRIRLPGDHHFGGDYDRLAEVILKGGA